MTTEDKLIILVSKYIKNPLGFIRVFFPWGFGLLKGETGPEDWQAKTLKELGHHLLGGRKAPLYFAIASGHDVGKTALVAWIILWFLSTRPHPQIVVTANTKTQLETKTWRELAKWHNLLLNKHWFEWTASKFYYKRNPETWFASAIPWTKERSEAFAGTHEKYVLMIFDEACHDEQTEVMTADGWKLWGEVSGSDKLLTMNPENRLAEYQSPIRLHCYDYDGGMFRYRADNADLCVTPGHRMFCRQPNGKSGFGPWKFQKARDLSKSGFQFPRFFKWTGGKIDSDWAEFLGWYCAEGSIGYRADGIEAFVAITNKNLSRPIELCRRLKLPYRVYPNCSAPQLRVLRKAFAQKLLRLCDGHYSYEKRIPKIVRDADPEGIENFLRGFLAGDGYVKDGTQVFYTSSKRMAGDLQELIFKAGHTASIRIRKIAGQKKRIGNHIATTRHDGYVIRKNEGRDVYARHSNWSIEPYAGKVYCAELEKHHLLFTRRNGFAVWSGNSAIDDQIWEVASGAMLEPGAIWLALGNPTRSTGRFKECFPGGKFAHRWKHMRVDSREVRRSNKEQIKDWIKDYGDDSDFVRIRVKGIHPRASSTQFIPEDIVDFAMNAHLIPGLYDDAPVLIGVDVARFGDCKSVISVRQGGILKKIRKFSQIDTMNLAGHVTEDIREFNPAAVFVDGIGMGAGVCDRLRQLGYDVIEVNGAEKALNEKLYHNLRAEMWGNMKDWLKKSYLPKDDELKADLCGLEYGFDDKNRFQLEKKEDMRARGIASPDTADALALTFAYPVSAGAKKKAEDYRRMYEEFGPPSAMSV